MRTYAIIVALISAALFAWVLGSEADEIALRDFGVFTVALTLILTVQLFLLSGLEKAVSGFERRKKEWGVLGAAALILALNAYFLAFYTLEQPTGFRLAYAVVVGVAFLILMSIRQARPVMALFAGIMLVMSLFQYGYTRATMGVGDEETAATSLPVNSKRNVYIIGMESLQSPAAYRENLGIQKPAHVRAFQDAGFRVLDRAYSAERSTLRSWSNILEFKREVKGTDLGARGPFVNDNTTFRSFRDSNYGIQFLYKNSYFPVNLKYVDFLYPSPAFDACDELGPFYFYGLCSEPVVEAINKYIFRSSKISWKPQIALLRKRADVVSESSRPWLTWTHIKYPFHTHGYMKHPDPKYAADFKKRVNEALPIVAENVRETAGYIVSNDPNAVVVVLGDHGTHLFRGDEKNVKEQVAARSPLFPLEAVLEDQHGVNVAVYPADFCVNRISELFSTKALMESMIQCLNGDDVPTDEDRRRAHMIRFLGDMTDVRDLRPKTLAQPQD